MFVGSLRARGHGLILAGALALAGCAEPTENSSLRPSGPPEVLAVLVANDPTTYGEVATFCKLDDAKRPGEVGLIDTSTIQVCDPDLSVGADPVIDADPMSWRVRIMFDELLAPDIEELIPLNDGTGAPTGTYRGSIANTHPVELVCGGIAVTYDGYYSPSGNALTWPLGPALVIVPLDATAVAGGTECTVIINDVVTDKEGKQVPTDGDPLGAQRGPYRFTIARIALTSTSPAGITDPTTVPTISPTSAVTFRFNTLLDPASLTTADVRVFSGVAADCTGGNQLSDADVVLFQARDPAGDVIDPRSLQLADASATGANPAPADPLSTGNMFEPETGYRVEIVMDAEVSDLAHGVGALRPLTDGQGTSLTMCFETDVAP